MGMVLKNTIQKRIGIVFFLFSVIILSISTIRGFAFTGIDGVFTARNLCTLIYLIIFALSILHYNKLFKFFQLLAISVEGFLIIILSPEYCFFGLTLIILCIILAYVYGFFDKHVIVKSLFIFVLLFVTFSQFSLKDYQTPILSSLMWVLFLCITLFVLWIIFKEYIEEHKNQVQLREEYLQESLKELQIKLEEYTEISHISLDTNKELLEIIKNHKAGGCDGRK